jgi:hypothetical protein
MYLLTPGEDIIRCRVEKTKGFPRWRYHNPTPKNVSHKTFLYYTKPGVWVQEVSKCREIHELWKAGVKFRGTLHLFSDLQDALDYGEKLANKDFADYQARLFE